MEFNLAKTGRQRSHSSRFQNQTRHLTQTNTHDEGLWFSFHKNYKLGPTYLRLTIFYWQSSTFTSTANTTVLVIRALCKFVFPNLPRKFDQSTLISGTPFSSQWYFPLSENYFMTDHCKLSFPHPLFVHVFMCSCAARFACPNRRACSQAVQETPIELRKVSPE